MLDTWQFRLPTDGWAYDPETQAEVQAFAVLFTTRGRLTSGAAMVRDVEVGGRTAGLVTRELHIPINSPAVPADAYAVCTAVDASSDPTLLGARVEFSGSSPASQKTARRLQVTEVVS
jgi:hypothetical protein